jgi:hypothetical protein
MMDLKQIGEIVAQFVIGLGGLSVIIFAWTAYLKQWGVRGKALTASAFVSGFLIALGACYALAPMVGFAGWFWAAMFGLLAGAMATGAYKGAESATGKELIAAPFEYLDEDGHVTGSGRTVV